MAAACPTCQKPAAPRPHNPSAPFCCPRCRQVDLGRWLGEEYRVPDASRDGEPERSEPDGRQEDESAR
jgi:endogenous inhibitor of DNA gyrase (YacG/DUF329 family)